MSVAMTLVGPDMETGVVEAAKRLTL